MSRKICDKNISKRNKNPKMSPFMSMKMSMFRPSKYSSKNPLLPSIWKDYDGKVLLY